VRLRWQSRVNEWLRNSDSSIKMTKRAIVATQVQHDAVIACSAGFGKTVPMLIPTAKAPPCPTKSLAHDCFQSNHADAGAAAINSCNGC
jgi:hypothetical protein